MRVLGRALVLLVVTLVLEVTFFLVSGSRGLLSPGGTPHLDVVGLGLALLLARIAARFAVPGMILYGAITARARAPR